jgi:DNA repair exonuclease SbcCD ATPase subunit
MTPLYLTRIALRQFRSFATLDVELAPRPGVLIVHGSNGLGKSSLFEALEWSLTDRIDHFRDASGVGKPGTYLCRWREDEPGPTSTTMQFSDGSIIERCLLSAKATDSQLGGNAPDITALLRAPAWQQRISELQHYLLLTHFLGQSTLSRLTHRKSSERFDILKEAAQSTAIEAIADALHGQGNNTVVRAYARQIETLDRETRLLDDLLEQEMALWAEAQISGAIDEAGTAIEARRIVELITRAQLSAQVDTGVRIIGSEPTIERLQAMVDRIDDDILKAEGQIDGARRLHSERQRVLTDAAEVTAACAATLERLGALDGELELARRRRGERRSDAEARQTALAAANRTCSRMRAFRDALALVARLMSEQNDSFVALTSAKHSKANAERGVASVERKRQILARLAGEIARCDETLDRLNESVARADRAIACDDRIRDLAAALAALEADNPDIDQAVARAEATAKAANDGVSTQAAVVEGLRDTVGTMSNAVASIAARLPTDACDCPLCATHFDSASSLHARISTAALRLAPALLTQEELLRSLSAARDASAAELDRLQDMQSQIRFNRSTLRAEREQRAAMLGRLDGLSSDDTSAPISWRALFLDEIAALSARRQRKARWQAHRALGGGQDLIAEHSRAVRERDAAQRMLDAATRNATDLSIAFESAKADATNASTALDLGREVGADEFGAILREAEATALRAREAAEAAARALTDADAAVNALEAEQAGLHARRDEMGSRKTDLDWEQRGISNEWRALGRFGSEPDIATIQIGEGRLAVSKLAIKEAASQLKRLREGRLAWARQLSHRAVLEQIREQVDGPPNSSRDELLQSAQSLRSRKDAEADAIREVKEIAKAASADISAELNGFNSEYIKPLGFLMSQINQAILCDARVGIDLHVKKKKIEQSAVKVGEVPIGLGEIDPVLVHSEGQMAALAVSMLCAASLTFPWSRWKALVLDDPLQHNDSIHAAAFADLMGNLISAEGYQILLSTHDVAQAEFLQRKFRSRRIPCTTLSLLGIGKEGVEWSVQDSLAIGPHAASA